MYLRYLLVSIAGYKVSYLLVLLTTSNLFSLPSLINTICPDDCIILSTLFSNIVNLHSSFNVGDVHTQQVKLHPV
jgi:hypothetical protein